MKDFLLGFLSVLSFIETIVIVFGIKYFRKLFFLDIMQDEAVIDKESAKEFYRSRNFDIRK